MESKLMKILRGVSAFVAGAILVAGFTFANGAGAMAAESAEPTGTGAMVEDLPNLTDDQLSEGLQELKNSPLPRTSEVTATGLATTYVLGNGLTMTVNESVIAPRLGGGFEPNGQFYVSFNQFDQDMLISGAGFGLGAAICAIPGVGWVACTVVGAIITVGVVAVSTNAKCKNNKQLIVHVNPSWSTCR
ncbi:hypothetical protein [Leifsonia sp. NPDC058230]|uniref:hypothetical protein n=1 Tax=Leifsonia sp. NPDC058230 TaxID=3346391 RepID=UPI0036DD2D3E